MPAIMQCWHDFVKLPVLLGLQLATNDMINSLFQHVHF